tara:strand:- start:566 stop:1123 length:558 start_codon:yes stop_codon:yes gene_type:complete
MIKTMRYFLRLFFLIVCIFSLTACSGGDSAGLEPFKSSDGRYGFLYPTGWTKVAVKNGPEVVFHDLINSDETLSLVISKLESDITLEELGSAEEVGKRLTNEVKSDEKNDREVQLIETSARETLDHTFYDLEYSVRFPGVNRHELATVVVDRGYLYTLATSSSDRRWPKVKNLYQKVIGSFQFLI